MPGFRRLAAASSREPAPYTRRTGLVYGAIGIAVALAVWTLASIALAGGGGSIGRLPNPLVVAKAFVSYLRGDFLSDLVASLRVFAIGWLTGTVLATLVGLALGRIRVLGEIFLPVIEAIRPVSSIAWIPLSIVWFGFGLSGKVFLVGLAVFLVVIVYAVDGARRTPPDLERVATMLGMGPMTRFGHLVLPGTLTEVLIGARVALMAGWGTVIVAELVAADSGLGARLIAVQQSYNVPAVMASMIAFAVSGFAMNALFSRVERWLLPWRAERAERA